MDPWSHATHQYKTKNSDRSSTSNNGTSHEQVSYTNPHARILAQYRPKQRSSYFQTNQKIKKKHSITSLGVARASSLLEQRDGQSKQPNRKEGRNRR